MELVVFRIAWELHDISDFFFRVRDTLYSIANAIDGVPFIGEYLKVPYEWLAQRCEDVGWWFGDLFQWALQQYMLATWIAPGGFMQNIIRNLWPGTQWYMVDPIQWILDMVAKFLPDMLDIRGQIVDSLRELLLEWFPELMEFVEHPLDWFRQRLIDAFPFLYWFSIDPVAYITGEIYRLFPVTEYIFDDPVGWLKYRLSDIFGVDIEFWDDPLESIKASIQLKLLDMIEESKDELYEVGEKLFRYFLEGVW